MNPFESIVAGIGIIFAVWAVVEYWEELLIIGRELLRSIGGGK